MGLEQKTDIGNGWYRCRDGEPFPTKIRLAKGRYCDECNERIPQGDEYYTPTPETEWGRSIDICPTCWPKKERR
jgi:hypothetical protein